MTRSRLARRSFAILFFTIAAAALSGSGCGGCQKAPPRSIEPPTILSPQNGDTVGKSFSVQGTYGSPNVDVYVNVSGAHNDDKNTKSDPTWSIAFGPASATGSCTAKAHVTGSNNATVNFTIVDNPDLGTEPSDITFPPGPTAGGPTPPRKGTVKAKAKHTGGGNPTIKVTLIRDDGVRYGPVQATQQGMSPNWHATFVDVEEGYYAVYVERELAGQTTTTSRMEKVK
jgi:hypothetical protein